MEEVIAATTPTDRCPQCGSIKVGCCEVQGGGLNRFRLVCVDCKIFLGQPSTSVSEAHLAGKEILARWDNGLRYAEGEMEFEKMDATLALTTGEKRPPNVGKVSLEALMSPMAQKIQNAAKNEQELNAFRTQEEEERWAAGQPIGKTFICDVCQCTQQGARVAGVALDTHYVALPQGWYLQYPSARVFCSMLCVGNDRKAGQA